MLNFDAEHALVQADNRPHDPRWQNLRKNTKSLILVVDDAPINRKLMQTILEPAGYEVITAHNGPTALQIAQTAQPQLILLDVMMPGMDGYEVCRSLKENVSTRHIPVIFVTCVHDAESEARGFTVGAVDYITKPVLTPVVLARVKAHMAIYGQRRRLEGMFRDVMEFAPDAFILSDIPGNIIHINARTEQLFGYPREELIGSPIKVLILPHLHHDYEKIRSCYTLQPLGQMTGISLQCLRKDGSQFPCDINLSSLKTNQGRMLMAVIRDVSAHQQAEQALNESHQRLRELAAQNEATREKEKEHIAREVHDELGQVLTALRMDLSLLGMRYGTLSPTLIDKLTNMKGLVDRAIQGVRNVAVNLRPAALDMGLVPAIEWLCSEFTEHTAVPCQLHAQDENISLDETRNVVLFRIAQESLTNITRYARASQVDVTLARHDDELVMEVRDNGCGFDMDTTTHKKSFGLLGMRERALALGGELQVCSAAAQGVVIRVAIPIHIQPSKEAP